MKTKQSALAKKWGVSRSLISKYHSRGMPLNPAKAEAWLHQNVAVSKIHLNAETARLGPIRLEQNTPAEPEPRPPYLSDEDVELSRVEAERDKLLVSAWKHFKKKPVFNEVAPGYSEAELIFCWAVKGLLSNGISEQDALDFASFGVIVTAGTPVAWKPMLERREPQEKAA